MGSVLYRMWRVAFFPVAMLCLLIVAGIKGVVTFFCFGLIVYALQLISTGPTHRP